jgi:hypothetical protein
MAERRFRKRPIEVSAIQWTGENEREIRDWTGRKFASIPVDDRVDPEVTAEVYDELHSTWVGVKTGQWIVRGVKGEYYPIAEDVLAETYEPAVQREHTCIPCPLCEAGEP